jgi:Family of unknown function (DUF6130)
VEFQELLGMSIKNRRLHWLLSGLIGLTYWCQGGLALAAVGLNETAPPAVIAQLATAASGAPQVTVLSPRADEVVNTNNVSVNFQVQGMPIFKNAALGLGPHLHLLLDRVPYPSVYDLAQPITLSNLTPGTHTLQVLMAKPWHESWKNPGAFAQVTFHVFTKSAEVPAGSPTLVYNEPDGTYGAEPGLLDFYVANAPSHVDAKQQQINDWRVRATINDQSFEVDRPSPFYLKGLKPGANLVKLEYLNAQGQSIDSVLRVVNYQPNGTDGFSRLLRNELPLTDALALFDPNSRVPLAAPGLATTPQTVVPVTMPAPLVTAPVAILPPVNPVAAIPVEPLPTPMLPLPATVPITPLPVPTVVTPPVSVARPVPAITPAPPAIQPPAPSPVPVVVLPSPAPVATVNIPLPEKLPMPAAPDGLPLQPALPPTAMAPVVTAPLAAPVPLKKPVAIQLPLLPTEPLAPPLRLVPAPGENAIEFKVLAREFLHTSLVRIRQFTRAIPPTVAKWNQNLSHWISDRSQAMQSRPKAAISAVEKV